MSHEPEQDALFTIEALAGAEARLIPYELAGRYSVKAASPEKSQGLSGRDTRADVCCPHGQIRCTP